MVTEKLLFSNFRTMADKFPDCDAKELQQFKENAEIFEHKEKNQRPKLLFAWSAWPEEKGNSPGIVSFEASEVLRRGKKKGWFRLRARQFASN